MTPDEIEKALEKLLGEIERLENELFAAKNRIDDLEAWAKTKGYDDF